MGNTWMFTVDNEFGDRMNRAQLASTELQVLATSADCNGFGGSASGASSRRIEPAHSAAEADQYDDDCSQCDDVSIASTMNWSRQATRQSNKPSVSYKVFPNRRTVVVEWGIGIVKGAIPIIGITAQVHEKWKKLKARFGVKERQSKLKERTTSQDDVNSDLKNYLPLVRRGSDVGGTMAKFKKLEREKQEEAKEDVFGKDWKPPQFDKTADDYGRPKKGSLTEKRGIAAGNHIGKEIVQLCEVITENGYERGDGTVIITFGALFDVYNYISDKVVGMLLRARKHKLVDFEGEMLYQRQDERVIITLLKPFEEIQEMYKKSDDPAAVLKKLW